ncbi:DUF3967 domain-containing protein [Cytobacillus sp. IB215665]|uniref:DUF3967 domain-containing protein n=1 Tax=Cytobacillus sp. IB215665 TaxID=3097357 RepID=UPI002A1019E0|nr:DUF3967 domain-containing protein [Cytobacillus sp. IB215665]MDX8367816.1 DUF3967 domain-containing protein [Cytobacillus sp. IB215665]
MKDYSTKDIANITDIAESTVRKYSQLLEASGYVFNRNASGYRIFTKQDKEIFFELKNASKSDKSVEEIAHDIASKYIAKVDTTKDDVSGNTQPQQGIECDMLADLTKKLDVLTDMSEKQNKLNAELLKKLDQQQKYIDERLNERDKLLMQSLNEATEVRKQIAAATEEKKGFFAKLFGK